MAGAFRRGDTVQIRQLGSPYDGRCGRVHAVDPIRGVLVMPARQARAAHPLMPYWFRPSELQRRGHPAPSAHPAEGTADV